jgi:hypothetical protein
MPTQPRSRQSVKTDPTPDAIRIVALHVGDTLSHLAAAPAPTAQLTYRKGPVLTAVEVFTIFGAQRGRRLRRRLSSGR